MKRKEKLKNEKPSLTGEIEPEITIRTAEINDSESITELSNQLGYESNNDAIRNRLNEMLIDDDNRVFVATSDKKVIGWIHGFYTLRIESDPFVEIGGIVVHENYRNFGIGKILTKHLVKWAESKNCKRIRARCNIKRFESHRFYENMGFTLCKEQKTFDKELN